MRFAWLSVAVAIVTIALKAAAWALTGSVGLLSDALESVVNLVAAIVALVTLRAAEAPPDDEHPFGHDKVELFSSALEGALIFVAALAIVASAIPRLLAPRPLSDLGAGLLVSGVAAVINLKTASVLIRVGKQRRSLALEADGRHLMTDVWTSVGVIAGVGLVRATGLVVLDPIVALVVSALILKTGVTLLVRSARGMLDERLDADDLARLSALLDEQAPLPLRWHALRTRKSGIRAFGTVHVLVPGAWSVSRAHDLAHDLEQAATERVPGLTLTVHVEPLEDARAWDDAMIADRPTHGD